MTINPEEMIKTILHSESIATKWRRVVFDIKKQFERKKELTEKQIALLWKLYNSTERFR